jgi:hypothetical protein
LKPAYSKHPGDENLRKPILLSLIIILTAPSQAVAQVQNATPEVLKNIEAYKSSPEKLKKLLSDNYHLSISQDWPKNFPLPAYTSNVTSKSFTHSTKGRPSAGATLLTSDQPQTVFDFYKSACNRAGWKVKVPSAKALAELSTTGETYLLNAEQGKQVIFLTCRKNRDPAGTFVSITWTKRS